MASLPIEWRQALLRVTWAFLRDLAVEHEGYLWLPNISGNDSYITGVDVSAHILSLATMESRKYSIRRGPAIRTDSVPEESLSTYPVIGDEDFINSMRSAGSQGSGLIANAARAIASTINIIRDVISAALL